MIRMPFPTNPGKLALTILLSAAIFLTAGLCVFLFFSGTIPYYFVGRFDGRFCSALLDLHSKAGLCLLALSAPFLFIHFIEIGGWKRTFIYGACVLLGIAAASAPVLFEAKTPFLSPRVFFNLLFASMAALIVFAFRGYARRISKIRAGREKRFERWISYSGFLGFSSLAFGAAFGVVLLINAGVSPFFLKAHYILMFAFVGLALLHIVNYLGIPAAERTKRFKTIRARASCGTLAGAGLLGCLALAPVWKARSQYPAIFLAHGAVDEARLVPLAPANLHVDPGLSYAQDRTGDSFGCGMGGSCHVEIFQQWEASAHRFSNNLFVQRVERLLVSEAPFAAVKICLQCHAPVALVADAAIRGKPFSGGAFSEGVSCVACHSTARHGGEKGMGNMTLLTPKFSYQNGVADPMALMKNIDLHKNDMGTPFFKTNDLCEACHRIFIPKEINGAGTVLLADHAEELAAGPFRAFLCSQCHMRNYLDEECQVFRPSHRMEGAQQALSRMVDYAIRRGEEKPFLPSLGVDSASKQLTLHERSVAELARLVDRQNEKWLRGQVDIPELKGKWPSGPILDLQLAPVADRSTGGAIRLSVQTTNRKTGHGIPAFPRDLQETWLEIVAKDAAGGEFFHSGALDNEGYLDPHAIQLGTGETDLHGRLLRRHEVWKVTGKKFERTIGAGATMESEIRIPIPKGTAYPVEIRARWNYRRANKLFSDFVFDGEDVDLPITVYAEKTLTVNSNAAAPR